MRCDDVRELLSGYIDGTLDLDERSWVEEHLRRCHECASEVAALRTTLALVQQLDEVEPPPDFRAKLRRRILAEQRRERRGFFARFGRALVTYRGAVAVAATLALAVGVGTAIQSPAALAWLGLSKPTTVAVGQNSDMNQPTAPGLADPKGKLPDGEKGLLSGTSGGNAQGVTDQGAGGGQTKDGITVADKAGNGERQMGLTGVTPNAGSGGTATTGGTGNQDGGQVVATDVSRGTGTGIKAAAPTSGGTTGTGNEGAGSGPETGGFGGTGLGGSLGGPAIDQDIMAVLPQKVGKRASLQVEVRNVDEAVAKVSQLAERDNGQGAGYVESSNTYTDQTGLKHGTLTIKVPAETLLDVLAQVEKLGTLKAKSINGRDIVPDYTDAEARLKVLKQQESRYLEIVAKTKGVDEIIRLENELAAVRAKIELLQGRINAIKETAAYSAIAIDLIQAPVTTGAAPATNSSAGLSAGKEAGQAFMLTSRGLGVLAVRTARSLGGAAPVLIILAILWVAYVIYTRMRPARVRGRV
ncbi:MAG TPA: DUF4349 domain-containing protein [Bacillota bacterium]